MLLDIVLWFQYLMHFCGLLHMLSLCRVTEMPSILFRTFYVIFFIFVKFAFIFQHLCFFIMVFLCMRIDVQEFYYNACIISCVMH